MYLFCKAQQVHTGNIIATLITKDFLVYGYICVDYDINFLWQPDMKLCGRPNIFMDTKCVRYRMYSIEIEENAPGLDL